ncbi:TetR family transcriptional regulator [Georgenia soli]|uniref:TetR family transcriptional regulator n=2 Tax=Georgenia soli TaxID=638953 RepID=A0A2A9ER07_9MICO|nr:TetR family transcriptional regulator [Georgenia soli]
MDPRTRRTRAALGRAMAQLVVEAPLAQVSVAGLCRAAGVHRTTFYKHFRTVTELAGAVLGELFDRIDELEAGGDSTVWLEGLLAHAAGQRPAYAALIGPDGDPTLSRAVTDRLIEAAGRTLLPLQNDGTVLGTETATVARVMGFAAYGALEAVLLGADPQVTARACVGGLPVPWYEALVVA